MESPHVPCKGEHTNKWLISLGILYKVLFRFLLKSTILLTTQGVFTCGKGTPYGRTIRLRRCRLQYAVRLLLTWRAHPSVGSLPVLLPSPCYFSRASPPML